MNERQYWVHGAKGFAFKAPLSTVAIILRLDPSAVRRIRNEAVDGFEPRSCTLHFNGRPPIPGIGDSVQVSEGEWG